MVAFGKPLPVERINALKAEAIRVFSDQPTSWFNDPEESGKSELQLSREDHFPQMPGAVSDVTFGRSGEMPCTVDPNEDMVRPRTLVERPDLQDQFCRPYKCNQGSAGSDASL